MEFIYTL